MLIAFFNLAFAQSFATDTISGTPGFGSILDSGPNKFDSTVIDDRMADLAAEASSGECNAVLWAGTWVRNRTSRLEGTTDGGEPIVGSSITTAQVDGENASGRLTSGSQWAGTTESGNEVHGYFARISSRRSIWYGVEVDCNEEPSDPALALTIQGQPATSLDLGSTPQDVPRSETLVVTNVSTQTTQPLFNTFINQPGVGNSIFFMGGSNCAPFDGRTSCRAEDQCFGEQLAPGASCEIDIVVRTSGGFTGSDTATLTIFNGQNGITLGTLAPITATITPN